VSKLYPLLIFGKPELLGTPQRWEAAFLLLSVAAIDLFGGYIALSRRTMDVASPANLFGVADLHLGRYKGLAAFFNEPLNLPPGAGD
jgi:hypothetical protein